MRRLPGIDTPEKTDPGSMLFSRGRPGVYRYSFYHLMADDQVNNMRTFDQDLALERTISQPRLKRYLAESGGSLSQAIALYERNIILSEALYPVLQGLEICLRNTLNNSLADRYGRNWLIERQVPLSAHSASDVQSASKAVEADPDAIVAELKFSFWVGLLGPRYDATLWRSDFHRCFVRADGGQFNRAAVHGRMNALRRFRNRVAHHEPIFDRSSQMHGEAMEAISWMCADTYRWIDGLSRFEQIAAK